MTLRRTLLRPLVPVYSTALAFERSLRAHGRLPTRSLPEPVISVGSLSAGGAGKTPLVLALTKALTRRDYAVRILTRGYGRKGNATERVEPDGDSARFGDEPLLLAQQARIPVFVGADRYQAGLLAEQMSASQRVVYLLDDGFQHRRLTRDMDIVLLTRTDSEDVLLPAGNLREPLTRLREADVIVLREEEREPLRALVNAITGAAELQVLDSHSTRRPTVWIIQRRLDFPEGERPPQRPLTFCGIARPESFLTMLTEKAIDSRHVVRFPDHHAYSDRDITRLIAQAAQHGADGFVTTEKDAVKLTPAMRVRLHAVGPLFTPRLVVDLLDEKAAVDQIIGKVARLNRRRRIASA